MNEETIRIVKAETCPSLSGQSTLTYLVGFDIDNKLCIALEGNSGGGFFSKDWVVLRDALATKGDKPLTAAQLRSQIYNGKSANSGGFLLAALVSEGLLKLIDEKLRTYERTDYAGYEKKIQALMDARMKEDQSAKKGKGVVTGTKKPDQCYRSTE